MNEEVPKDIYAAFRYLKDKDFAAAESILTKGLEKAEAEENTVQRALFHSTLGVMAKMKGDFREAWRCYEKAEKLMPEDPALKIIMAKLLMDQFAQYDAAIKKLKQVLKLAKGSASFEHQAHAEMAVAYLKKGEKKKAVEMFDLCMTDDFNRMITSENINLDVIEGFLARNFEKDRCQQFIQKALALAKGRNEERQIQIFTKILEGFEATVH